MRRDVGEASGTAQTASVVESDSTTSRSFYERLGGYDAVSAVVGHLVSTLNEFRVPEREQGELLAVIGSLRPDIVEVANQ